MSANIGCQDKRADALAIVAPVFVQVEATRRAKGPQCPARVLVVKGLVLLLAVAFDIYNKRRAGN